MTAPATAISTWVPEPTQLKPSRWSRPRRPTDDPFYRAPDGFEELAPGTLLRSREIDVALLGLVPQRIAAWQLLYRTCDLDGVPEAAVTTILLPSDADVDQQRPLLAYQCAIDAVSDKCFPSYVFQRGAWSPGSLPPLELLVIANALRRGWAISVADHEGLDGYFGAPREPGYRVLDGVRAALDFGPLGLDFSAPVAAWGYSGGGMASSWVAEMAPTYAPEINLVGAALGAPVGDPGETYIRLNASLFAGLPALVVAGLRHAYPGLGRVIREHVDAAGIARLDEIERLSTVAAVVKFAKDDFDRYTDIPLADVLATPEVLHVFDDIRLGTHVPKCPVLVTHPIHDQIICVDDVDAQVDRYVDGGAHVTYLRDRVSEHLSLMLLSVPATLDWIADRFAGVPVDAPQTKTVWSIAMGKKSLRGFAEMGRSAFRMTLGRALVDM